jgi:hypothetical protein
MQKIMQGSSSGAYRSASMISEDTLIPAPNAFDLALFGSNPSRLISIAAFLEVM